MPIVHDKTTFRPAPTLAKLPSKAQKDALLEAFAKSDADGLRYPSAPTTLHGNAAAISHFEKLIRQIHPADFQNLVLLDYLAQASLVWGRIEFLTMGLAAGTIPNTLVGPTGISRAAPEFAALASFRGIYQDMLYSAGIKGANRLTPDDKAKAKAARTGKALVEAEVELPKLTGNVHKDKGLMGLLARAKSS